MPTITLAGGTGDLGGRIAGALIARGEDRRGGARGSPAVHPVGLVDRLHRARTRLEPQLRPATDLARARRRAPIRATSIFQGAFADLLAGEMPIIIRPIRRVVYWNDPDARFALTTKDNTAAFTAAAALDPDAPRDRHVAGTEAGARSLAALMTDLTGHRYKLLRAGSLAWLERLTAVTKRLFPQSGEVFRAWQGMQYLHGMFEGIAPSGPIDNDRDPGFAWTPVREVLARA